MSTNLPRITQKIFAQNAAEDDLLQFGSVLSGNATPSTSIAETQTTAYQTGWRSAVISDRNYPTLGEMNAVQQVPTQQLAYLFQKGIPEWDAGTTYYANVSYCQVNGVLYKSVSDNNIGNNPTTDNGTNWIIADLSNKITNCILSAPNGVATYSGSTITVKQGLKFLIPNGRNADGTLNNIETILPNDISRDVEVSSNGTYIALVNNTEEVYSIDYVLLNTYYESRVKPTSSTARRWLDTENNYYYALDSGVQKQVFSTKVLTFVVKDGQITALFPYQPVALAKEQDIDGMWVFSSSYVIQNAAFSADYKKAFDISDYLPNDGNVYEVAINVYGNTGTTAYNITGVIVSGGYHEAFVMKAETQTSQKMFGAGTCIIPVSASRRLSIYNSGGIGTGVVTVELMGYRKVR